MNANTEVPYKELLESAEIRTQFCAVVNLLLSSLLDRSVVSHCEVTLPNKRPQRSSEIVFWAEVGGARRECPFIGRSVDPSFVAHVLCTRALDAIVAKYVESEGST